MALKAGQYIRHAKYGLGTVVEFNDERTTIDFETAGLKKFVTSLASFEPAGSETHAPKHPAKRRAKARAPQAGQAAGAAPAHGTRVRK